MRSFRRILSLFLLLTLTLWVCKIIFLKLMALWFIFTSEKTTSVTIDPWVEKHWNHVKIIVKEKNTLPPEKTILLWTPFFGTPDYIPELSKLGCPVSKCIFTSNRTQLLNSDAVIFHLRDIDVNDMPSDRKSGQIWILLNHESPPHTPAAVLNQYYNVFNWTATYRYDSEILLSPIFVKRNQTVSRRESFFRRLIPKINRWKKRMAAWLVSNCKTESNREAYVDELLKYVHVDIYGACSKLLHCLPKMSDRCYDKLAKYSKFYLSFENSICKDYVTEKFFRIMDTDMVPVVMGGANYSSLAPPNSYVNAMAFNNPKDLASYLIEIAKDEERYKNFFKWKESYQMVDMHYGCKICKKLHEPVFKPTFYANISKWWYQDANCKTWSNNSMWIKL